MIVWGCGGGERQIHGLAGGGGPFAILSPAFVISVSDGDRRFSVGHTATVPLLSNTAVGRTSWLVKYSTLSVFLRPYRSRFFFISNHLRRQRPGGRYFKKPFQDVFRWSTAVLIAESYRNRTDDEHFLIF